MNVTYWVLFLFCTSLVLMLSGTDLGYNNIMNKYNELTYLNADKESLDINAMFQAVADNMISWNGLLFLGLIGIGGILSGFNLLVMLPLGAMVFLLNFIVFPLSTITKSGLPDIAAFPLMSFFYLSEIMIMISLLRGTAH